MNDEAKQTSAAPAAADTAQLIAAIALAMGGIVAFYVLKSRPEAWASWAALARRRRCSACWCSRSRSTAANFWQFVLEARVELRKVFWPAAQETFTTTLVVLGFVVIAEHVFLAARSDAGVGDEVLHRAREAER